MGFVDDMLAGVRPPALSSFELPRRERYHPSPGSWQDEVVYFLLVDRFSDGGEPERPLLDRAGLSVARPASADGSSWRWDRWAASGKYRFQGGTLAGVASKLDYLAGLGVTTVWLSPVFRQRGHLDTYHGYGVQDFLDVDPRFGSRADLVALIEAAHQRGLRVLLDVIFNHSGSNWIYPPGTPGGVDEPVYTAGAYDFGSWRDGLGGPLVGAPSSAEDGVWPQELQTAEAYTRAGYGSLDSSGQPDTDQAEFRRTDFEDLRDFALDRSGTLSHLAACYAYWIALTDCDGFRIDTVKHVTYEQARAFCGAIKEFALNLGKSDFFLVGEIPDDNFADRYLNAIGRNLNAALDIGNGRLLLRDLGRGLAPATVYFGGFEVGGAPLGSHRNMGDALLSVLDDHDHVFGEKLRFASSAVNDHEAVVPSAVQLFTLGIPCLYYGTEQGFAGPEPEQRQWLPGWGSEDRYLREAMFGPRFPRAHGRDGVPGEADGDGLDHQLPGFGPFGTAGAHCFDPDHPIYRRLAALTAVRRRFPVLRFGRQYLRPTSVWGGPFADSGAGELTAWSRLLFDEEAVCAVNPNGAAARGAWVLVDPGLNPPGSAFTVLANTGQAGGNKSAAHPVGSSVAVQHTADGTAYLALGPLGPSEVLVLVNRP